MENQDFLNSWREAIRNFAGDSEYDATAEAIKAYEESQTQETQGEETKE